MEIQSFKMFRKLGREGSYLGWTQSNTPESSSLISEIRQRRRGSSRPSTRNKMEQAGYLQNSSRLLNSLRAEQQSEAPVLSAAVQSLQVMLHLFLCYFCSLLGLLYPGPTGLAAPHTSWHAPASGSFLSLSLPSTWNSPPPSVCMTCFLPSVRELLKCSLCRKVLLKVSIENSSLPSPHQHSLSSFLDFFFFSTCHHLPCYIFYCYSFYFPLFEIYKVTKKPTRIKRSSVRRYMKPSNFPSHQRGLIRKHKN